MSDTLVASIPIATRRSATGIPNAKLAMWMLLASEIVIFGGLLVVYVMRRMIFDSWAAEAAHTNLIAGTINTFALLTSSLAAVLAHQAAEAKMHEKAFSYLWGAILGGLVFLVIKAFEWTHEISEGFTITTNLFWSFYYTALGIHGLHVIVGMIAMGIVSMDVKKGLHLNRVEIVGIYWCFVEIIWIFLFPLVYIAR
jgi:heme/copper-type cytochrome/quinol oxidase subunit 3